MDRLEPTTVFVLRDSTPGASQFSPAFRKDFFRKNNVCANCGTAENLMIHHIVPIKAGGTDNVSNLVALCGECHQATHACLNNIRPGNDRSRLGRRGREPDDIQAFVHDVLFGYVSLQDAKSIIGLSDRTDFKQRRWFTEEMKRLGIVDYRNNIAYLQAFGFLKKGRECGWIETTDGERKPIFYLEGTKRKLGGE